MKKKFIFAATAILFICCCVNKSHKFVLTRINAGTSSKVEERDIAGFVKVFGEFYRSGDGKFFVRSKKIKEKASGNGPAFTDIYIEVPEFDSTTFSQSGQYWKDSSKVVCVFENSDGGNYVELESVHAKSFSTCLNVFGGKDSSHVFFQNEIIEGLNPQSTHVYSKDPKCTNCSGYFKDGNVIYYGSKKVLDKGFVIPEDYKYVE